MKVQSATKKWNPWPSKPFDQKSTWRWLTLWTWQSFPMNQQTLIKFRRLMQNFTIKWRPSPKYLYLQKPNWQWPPFWTSEKVHSQIVDWRIWLKFGGQLQTVTSKQSNDHNGHISKNQDGDGCHFWFYQISYLIVNAAV